MTETLGGSPRYVVGIDLGTTNSAVTYVDTAEEPWSVRTFSVPQVVAPGQVERRETLPSFHYEPATGEFDEKALKLPFDADTNGGNRRILRTRSRDSRAWTTRGFGQVVALPFGCRSHGPSAPLAWCVGRDKALAH